MSDAKFGKLGFERTNVKVMPLGDPSVDDVIDQIYEVLHQAGYALRQGDYFGQKMMVLCRMHEDGWRKFKFEPRAQITSIVPEYIKDQQEPVGVEMRRISAVEPPKVS